MNKSDENRLKIRLLQHKIKTLYAHQEALECLMEYYNHTSEFYSRLESEKYRITGLTLDAEIRLEILKSQ